MIFFNVAYSAVKDMGLIIPKPPNRGGRDNSFLSVSPGAGLALSAGISCSRIEDSSGLKQSLWNSLVRVALEKISFSCHTSNSHYYSTRSNFRQSGELSGLLPFPSARAVSQCLCCPGWPRPILLSSFTFVQLSTLC